MNEILAKKYIYSCALILTMIIASLYFNILALNTPFLTVHHFLEFDQIYSLFGSVILLWGYKLYIMAILIVGFSIIFPFVKLIALFLICFVIKGAKARTRTITITEAFAKLSMLNVFVICILLIFTDNGLFVSSEPNIGVYYFLLAIFISIICAILADNLCEKTCLVSSEKINKRQKFISEQFTVYEKALMIILLLISIVFFIFTITDNYFQISEGIKLSKGAYSILETCISLEPLSSILEWFIGFVLIIFPSLKFNYLFIFWTTPYHPTFHIKIMKFIKYLSKFSMLDVFCLTLILFLIEGGSDIIDAESRPGINMLVLFLFISFFFPLFITFYTRVRHYFDKI